MSDVEQSKRRFRLYIDESGDHTHSESDEPGKRYLGLTGVIFESGYYRQTFHADFESFKQKHFPHNPDDPVILHRKDIINCDGPFATLSDPVRRQAFDDHLLQVLEQWTYLVVTVVIDKKAHVERYGVASFHPYHYCLTAMLERYCGLLHFRNAIGDVMAESRGGSEDVQLKDAYRQVYESGTQFRANSFFQQTLSSRELKVKKKEKNIAGLQLADIIAFPCTRDVLLEHQRIASCGGQFNIKVCRRVCNKYNRHALQNRIRGYGKVFLA